MLGDFERLDPAIVCAVDLRAEVIHDTAAVIVNWAEVKLVPEGRSILAVVEEFDTGLALLSYRGSYFGNGDFGCCRTLQEPAVFAENLSCMPGLWGNLAVWHRSPPSACVFAETLWPPTLCGLAAHSPSPRPADHRENVRDAKALPTANKFTAEADLSQQSVTKLAPSARAVEQGSGPQINRN